MADRDGKGEPALAPGRVYIEVEYDYEYKAKDRLVTIRQGECYMLVRKTNEDWWQVRRDEGTKAFYVPAQYVRELRKALVPPQKPQGSGRLRPGVLEIHRSNENLNKPHEMTSFGRPASGPRDANQNLSSPGHFLNNNNHHHGGGTPDSPTHRAFDHGRHPLDPDRDRTTPPCDSVGEGSEKFRHDSESGDDLSSSSTEQVQYCVSPPQPGDTAKSRSLERKQPDPIVLTKWRHSTCVLDLNDKELATGPKQGSPDSDSCPSSPKYPSAVNAPSPLHSSSPTSPHPQDPLTGQPSEKCGVLNVTKITENGKKVRKNWTSSWTVLQGSSLLFAKGQGGGTSWKFGGSQSKPEFTVDLRGGSVEWASKDKSSKKHVIELKTRKGTELLIQSEIDSVINDWYKTLVETVNTHAWESDEAIEEDMPESPGTEKHDKDKEKDQRDSKKNRTMKITNSMDADQKKTRVKLKKFLTRRPTLQAVRDKGYIKDQVFGCSLTSLCQRESTTVPNFVRMCIDHVEKTGLGVDGLYRVSGNLAVVQKLRFAVNHDEKVNLEDSKWEDIHVTTGALKMFFRELPEPLFTYSHFGDFVNAIKCPDYKQRVHLIRDLLKQLPRPNQDTMQALFMHLRKVVENGELNRMTTQSVAIVFGPTLLRPETETANIAVHMVYQNQIVELILLEYDAVFGSLDWGPLPWEAAPGDAETESHASQQGASALIFSLFYEPVATGPSVSGGPNPCKSCAVRSPDLSPRTSYQPEVSEIQFWEQEAAQVYAAWHKRSNGEGARA
uniref:Rho GTPase activating protein 12 n=1 Tax=Scleropages formosus TaxID=113540 RepID=A0A8C9VMH4_SCLFO